MLIKDKGFRSFLIPALGIFIPLASGLINFYEYTVVQLIISNLFFILTSYTIWTGSFKIISIVRKKINTARSIFTKLAILSVCAASYNSVIILLLCCLWQLVVLQRLVFEPLMQAILISSGGVIILTLIYESIFLTTEREIDIKILNQLDQEKMLSEANILSNELDPHFFFNCLNSLTYLVRTNQEKANQYIEKLASFFKYFLINKEKDVVTLDEEIKFLEDYGFILKIRFNNSFEIHNKVNSFQGKLCILPCTLQILVENAIKHNSFTEKCPLIISININQQHIIVSNPVTPKLYTVDSTKIGLRNLNERYWLMIKKYIIIESGNNVFTVRLPLIKKD